jgi:hypothetical protein
VYEWSDQPSHSRHMESGSRLSISWNCPWLGRVPRFMLPVGFSNADASAPCGVMVGHCLNGGILLKAALADDDLQKGTKVRDSVVGR